MSLALSQQKMRKINFYAMSLMSIFIALGIFTKNINIFSLSLAALIALYWIINNTQLSPTIMQRKLNSTQAVYANTFFGLLYLAPIVNLRETIQTLTWYFNL